MLTLVLILFWGSIGLIVYVFAGYPAAIALRAKLRPSPWKQQFHLPRITIVVAAHNEAHCIVQKVRNLLSLDYPADRVEVLVGSDGSTDGTAEQLLALHEPRLRVVVFSERRGKPSVLNALLPSARGQFIVFADTRQIFDSQSLRALTRAFADPEVGAVTGELIVKRTKGAAGAGSYWDFEKFVRDRECAVRSTVVVTGAIYAIRKELFEPIPPDTIVEDLLVPMRIIRRGYRVVFDRHARAFETAVPTNLEFARKVRTLAGAFQLLGREWWILDPRRNRLWWETMSHKVLRLLIAPLQVVVFAANLALASHALLYSALLVAQTLFYTGAIVGILLPRQWKKPSIIALPYTFCVLSTATVVGFVKAVTRRQAVTWRKAVV